MPDLLVILGANLSALAIARNSHRLGVKPIVVDVAPGPALASRLTESVLLENSTPASAMEVVLALAARGQAWLIASSDAWTAAMMSRREALDAAYHRVLHPPNEALAVCLSKSMFSQWCEMHSIPRPMEYRIRHGATVAPCDIVYPVMVRPGETLHSRPVAGIGKAVEIGSKNELEAYLPRFWAAGVIPVVTRSLLHRPLTQLSVGAAVVRGEMLTVTTRKVRPSADACRVGTLVETVDAADAEAVARKVLDALEYTGIAEVEILRTDDDGALYVIEVNARPWLQLDLGAASGRDLLGFLVSDGALRSQGPARRSTWLDFSGDLYSCFNAQDGAVRRGTMSVGAYVRSLWRANAYARWSPSDPLPFLLEAWQLLRLLLARLS